jgi:hypothetical protein
MNHLDNMLEREPALLANYFHISEEDLKAKAVMDPRAAVAADVSSLRAIPALPAQWLVSGLVLRCRDRTHRDCCTSHADSCCVMSFVVIGVFTAKL